MPLSPIKEDGKNDKKTKVVIYKKPGLNQKVNMYDNLSKIRIENLVSNNTELALALHKKTLEKIKVSGVKAHLTKTALLKLISLIYIDKIKIPQNKYNPLIVIAYDFTLNRFGIRKIAENKFVQVLFTLFLIFFYLSLWKHVVFFLIC